MIIKTVKKMVYSAFKREGVVWEKAKPDGLTVGSPTLKPRMLGHLHKGGFIREPTVPLF